MPSELPHAFLHAHNAHTHLRNTLVILGQQAQRHAAAVVLDFQDHLILSLKKPDLGRGTSRVPLDVGKALLDYTK